MSHNINFDCWCYTKKGKLSGKFVWKIEEFHKITESFKSCVFPLSERENLGKWCVWLYPYGSNSLGQDTRNTVNCARHNASNCFNCPGRSRSNNGSGSLFGSNNVDAFGTISNISTKPHISIFIYQEANIEIWATVTFSLINDKGNVVKSEVTQCKKFTQQASTGIENFVERDYVINKSNCVLPNDILTIICEIEIGHPSTNTYHEFVPAELERPVRGLSEDMGNLLSSELLTDLTITVGERQFRAHKAILAARSTVFAAMFQNEMAEKKSSSVKITDIDQDVFQEMLEYVYTGNEISQTNRTKELLAVAEKYQLQRLKFMCEKDLCGKLAVDNVLDNITLADLCSASYLKKYALHFIIKNSSAVIGSSDWDNFKLSHHSLGMEILEKICLLK